MPSDLGEEAALWTVRFQAGLSVQRTSTGNKPAATEELREVDDR